MSTEVETYSIINELGNLQLYITSLESKSASNEKEMHELNEKIVHFDKEVLSYQRIVKNLNDTVTNLQNSLLQQCELVNENLQYSMEVAQLKLELQCATRNLKSAEDNQDSILSMKLNESTKFYEHQQSNILSTYNQQNAQLHETIKMLQIENVKLRDEFAAQVERSAHTCQSLISSYEQKLEEMKKWQVQHHNSSLSAAAGVVQSNKKHKTMEAADDECLATQTADLIQNYGTSASFSNNDQTASPSFKKKTKHAAAPSSTVRPTVDHNSNSILGRKRKLFSPNSDIIM